MDSSHHYNKCTIKQKCGNQIQTEQNDAETWENGENQKKLERRKI